MKKLGRVGLFLFALFLMACTTPSKNLKARKMNHTVSSYGQSLTLKPNETYDFPDFSLTYLQDRDPEEGLEHTSTANTRIRYFLLKANNLADQEIAIPYGQLPPDILEFKTKEKTFVIYSHQSPSGAELFPNYFVVIEKRSK